MIDFDVKDGVPSLSIKELESEIGLLKDGGYELVIRKRRKHRSREQNNYYWGVVLSIFSDHWGYTKDECHDLLLSIISREPSANGRPGKIKRSSLMTTVEFEDYMERLRRWAAVEHGLYIPMPNEINYGEYE